LIAPASPESMQSIDQISSILGEDELEAFDKDRRSSSMVGPQI